MKWIIEGINFNVKTILARNSLHNFSRFSPYQLAFGKKYNFAQCDKCHTIDNRRKETQVVVENIKCHVHKTREEFIKNEANVRISQALIHQMRLKTDLES